MASGKSGYRGAYNVADTNAAKILIFTGPLLTVDIGLDQTYRPGTGKHPDLAMKGLQALVDTGAGECCIDSDLASHLQLPIIDRAQIAGAHGLKSANVHLAQIHCPKLEFTMYGRFAALDLKASGVPHYALIGRTFLRHMRMVYDGKEGKVELIKI